MIMDEEFEKFYAEKWPELSDMSKRTNRLFKKFALWGWTEGHNRGYKEGKKEAEMAAKAYQYIQ